MKRLHRLLYGLIVALLPSMASCGILDIDFDAETNLVESITFQYDTVYVMENDTFFLAPYFYPDTVVSKNVTWVAEDDSIVRCIGSDTIVAAGVGTTHVIVSTVANGKSDTCQVNVMPRWELDPHQYPYEMVVYANISYEGKTIPANMKVGAFCNDEFRGVAVPMNVDRSLYRFRISGLFRGDAESYQEEISILAYDGRTLQLYKPSLTFLFDGESHGLPSSPIEIKIK